MRLVNAQAFRSSFPVRAWAFRQSPRLGSSAPDCNSAASAETSPGWAIGRRCTRASLFPRVFPWKWRGHSKRHAALWHAGCQHRDREPPAEVYMPPPEPFRIVIAGAGIAGSILAQGLMHQPGLDVICLEQVGPDDHAEAGTGLNIGPNAIKALW